MNVGGQLLGQLTQVVLQLAEAAVLGQIDQPLGHLPQHRFGIGTQPAQKGLNPRFTV